MLKSTQKALVLFKSVDYPKNVLLRVINYDTECLISLVTAIYNFDLNVKLSSLFCL